MKRGLPRRLTQTAVASITPPTPTVTPTYAPTYTPLPIPPTNVWLPENEPLLPAPLYYLAYKSNALQIMRLERDGKTKRQITQAPTDIRNFDVASLSGNVAYVTGNELYIADALGVNPRRVVFPSLDVDPRWGSDLNAGPVWSPDGQRLAFGYSGRLVIYNVADDKMVVIPSPSTEYMLRGPFMDSWSPDGNEMLVEYAYEGDSGGVHLITTGDKPTFQGVTLSNWYAAYWSHSGQYIYFASSLCFDSNLSRIALDSGKVTNLIDPNLPYLTHCVTGVQEAPDGTLYYFYSNLLEYPADYFVPDYKLYRSGLDGISARTLVRSETHQVTEVLWAPDLHSVVIVDANDRATINDVSMFGARRILYLTTDNKPTLELEYSGFRLRWGKN